MLFMTLFMVILALIPTVLAWREWWLWYALYTDGVTQPIEVQHVWATKLGLLTHYYLIYEFEVLPEGEYGEQGEGIFNQHYGEIPRELYQQIQAGEVPLVRYARHNPRLFRLADLPFERTHWTFSASIAWLVASLFMYLLVLSL